MRQPSQVAVVGSITFNFIPVDPCVAADSTANMIAVSMIGPDLEANEAYESLSSSAPGVTPSGYRMIFPSVEERGAIVFRIWPTIIQQHGVGTESFLIVVIIHGHLCSCTVVRQNTKEYKRVSVAVIEWLESSIGSPVVPAIISLGSKQVQHGH